MAEEERKTEIERLERMLKAREDMSGYADNIKVIKARLSELNEDGKND